VSDQPEEPVTVTPAADADMGRRTFPISLGRLSRLYLVLWGVRPSRAEVTIDDAEIAIRFGLFGARIPIELVERWDITGPYRWIRAIGIRHSIGQPDISFCGDAHGAVRLWLRAKRHIAWVNASQVYVAVADLDALGAELTRRGIAGEDLRGR
jgi:hypothetical protein